MSVWGQGRTILSRVVRESLREIVALEWADLEEVREQSLTWAGLGKGGVAGRVPEGTAKATPPPHAGCAWLVRTSKTSVAGAE